MGKLDMVAEKWGGFRSKLTAGLDMTGSVYDRIKRIIGIVVMIFYRLRKVFLAIPVVYYAIQLARYNMEHLPDVVGVNLMSNGAFADTISREMAVMGPLGVTAACLVMMFLSRKALYSWAVSLFTLALPVILLLSNLYPV